MQLQSRLNLKELGTHIVMRFLPSLLNPETRTENDGMTFGKIKQKLQNIEQTYTAHIIHAAKEAGNEIRTFDIKAPIESQCKIFQFFKFTACL